jgi:hypothetical protein
VANYNIDIGVKVQAQQLDKFNKKIKSTTNLIKNANNSIKNYQKGNLELVRSINGVNTVLSAASQNFKEVAVGTPQATRAAKEFVKAEQLVNKTLAEQEKLLERVRRKQQGKEFTMSLRRQGFKKNQIRQSDGSFINMRRQELQIINRAATLEDRINQTLLKRGKILSANGKQIINNNRARSVGGRGRRFQNALSSGLIGGGFPLLFGQGPTAALGGALGGVAGGAIGGQFGFALSIAGTTIGSALDNLANALAKPTENIQLLVDKIGLANTPTGDLALRLEKVGLSATAADLLLDEFNKKFGKTPEDIKKNTQQMNKFKNQINELGTAITLLLSKVLSPAIQSILNFINRQSIANKIGRFNLASIELQASNLAAQQTKEKFGFKIGAVTGPLAGEGVEDFYQEQIKVNTDRLVNAEINKKLIAEGKKPIDFNNQELSFGEKFEAAQKKLEKAEFNQNIRTLEQSLKLEKDRLNISSEQFTLKQEQFKLDNLNADLKLLEGELGENNSKKIKRQIKGLKAQIDLQKQIVQNAERLVNLEDKKDLKLFLKENAKEMRSLEDEDQKNYDDAIKKLDRLKESSNSVTKNLEDQNTINQIKLTGSEYDIALTEAKIGLTKEELALFDEEAFKIAFNNKLRIDGLKKQKQITQDIKNLLATEMSTAIKGLITGANSLNDAFRNILNRMADAFLNIGLFGNVAGNLIGGKGLLGNIFGGLLANGGPAKAGKSYIVGERGPELFTPGVSGMVSPNSSLGGSTNIVVNVDASGSNVEGDEEQGRELGRLISVAVQSELVQQKRPGGLLA